MGGKNLDKKNWYRFFSPLPWHTKKKLTYLKRLQPYIAGAVVLACTGHQLQIFVSVQCNIKRSIQVRTLRITQSFYPAAEFVQLTCSILTSSILGEFLSLSMEDWLDMEVLLDSKPSSSSMPAQQIKITCTQCLLTSKSTLPGGKRADKKNIYDLNFTYFLPYWKGLQILCKKIINGWSMLQLCSCYLKRKQPSNKVSLHSYLANFSSAISDSDEEGELSVLGELRHLEKHLGKRLKELEVSLSEGLGGEALGTLPFPALLRCLSMMEARCSSWDNSWYTDVSWLGSAHNKGRNCLWRAGNKQNVKKARVFVQSDLASLKSYIILENIIRRFLFLTYPVL